MCGQKWLGLDPALELFLQADGTVFSLKEGFQVKYEVRKVSSTREIPHGIRYNLVLLDRYKQRVLGFDNAHRVRTGKRRHGVWSKTWDHIHIKDQVIPYKFESVVQLNDDFWMEVEKHVSVDQGDD
jgi:hypothetical protein